MAPHWWIPVRASDASGRKREVGRKLPDSATLDGFWKTPDGAQLYAVIKCDTLTHQLLVDIGANGKPIALEEVD